MWCGWVFIQEVVKYGVVHVLGGVLKVNLMRCEVKKAVADEFFVCYRGCAVYETLAKDRANLGVGVEVDFKFSGNGLKVG